MTNQYSAPDGTSIHVAQPPTTPLLYIVECRVAGAFATHKPDVAAKWAKKPGVVVTPYISKLAAMGIV